MFRKRVWVTISAGLLLCGCASAMTITPSADREFRGDARALEQRLRGCGPQSGDCAVEIACEARFPRSTVPRRVSVGGVGGYLGLEIAVDRDGTVTAVRRVERLERDRTRATTQWCPDEEEALYEAFAGR